LIHVLRNAVAHGIETPRERQALGKARRGVIRLRAEQRGSEVEIAIVDDGRGVSAEVLAAAHTEGSLVDLLTRSGYSSADEVSELAGRGVGLDAVRARVEAFGGRLDIRSDPGRGTAVAVMLPLSLALLEVLLVERGGTVYGVPLFAIQEVLAVGGQLFLEGRSSLELRGLSVPLFDLAEVVGAAAPPLQAGAPAAIVTVGERRAALACDRLLGQEEIVVKALGLLARVPGYLGGAILGDGRIARRRSPRPAARAARRLLRCRRSSSSRTFSPPASCSATSWRRRATASSPPSTVRTPCRAWRKKATSRSW
jgi:chemotaxis protein histidine kinase CheA